MAKYYRHAFFIAVFLERKDAIVSQLNQFLLNHFLKRNPPFFQRLHCNPAICSRKCSVDAL